MVFDIIQDVTEYRTSRAFRAPIRCVSLRRGSAKPAARVSTIRPANCVPTKVEFLKKPTSGSGSI